MVPGLNQATNTCLVIGSRIIRGKYGYGSNIVLVEGPLLLPLGGIVRGIHVQRAGRRQFAAMGLLEPFDAGGNETIDQPRKYRRGREMLKA